MKNSVNNALNRQQTPLSRFDSSIRNRIDLEQDRKGLRLIPSKIQSIQDFDVQVRTSIEGFEINVECKLIKSDQLTLNPKAGDTGILMIVDAIIDDFFNNQNAQQRPAGVNLRGGLFLPIAIPSNNEQKETYITLTDKVLLTQNNVTYDFFKAVDTINQNVQKQKANKQALDAAFLVPAFAPNPIPSGGGPAIQHPSPPALQDFSTIDPE